MDLETKTVTAAVIKLGQVDDIAVAAGETLSIEVEGADEGSAVCPGGKVWVVGVSVTIVETDA